MVHSFFTAETQRRGERNYIFLLREQKYINCHEAGFFVFRPLNGKQNSLNLCELCVSAVKMLFGFGFPGLEGGHSRGGK
jgi:hypothetical protein